MLKFFRKIRQNLLLERKNGKYLKYAVGEIVLVVIGILIALQINNWNEKRLDKVLSLEFHERLADELDAIAKRLDSDVKRAKIVKEYIVKSVNILKSGVLTDAGRDTLNYTLENFFQFVRIDGELKTFQEMESTGQLGLIYNKELKSQTLEYLATLESISKIYDQVSEQVNNTDLVDKYVTLNLEIGSSRNTLSYNIKDMAKDNYLINKLARYGYCWQTKQFFSHTLSISTKDLKDAYLEELGKRD